MVYPRGSSDSDLLATTAVHRRGLAMFWRTESKAQRLFLNHVCAYLQSVTLCNCASLLSAIPSALFMELKQEAWAVFCEPLRKARVCLGTECCEGQPSPSRVAIGTVGQPHSIAVAKYWELNIQRSSACQPHPSTWLTQVLASFSRPAISGLQ